jgi:hypothetical protein
MRFRQRAGQDSVINMPGRCGQKKEVRHFGGGERAIRILACRNERVVGSENTVAIADWTWQIEKTKFRHVDGKHGTAVSPAAAGVPALTPGQVPKLHSDRRRACGE